MSAPDPTPWKKVLAEPGPDGHIVELYQDDRFFGAAVSHFTAEGLARGDAIIIAATAPHWDNIAGRLAAQGFDPAELVRRGRLTRLDADETLPRFMVRNMPDGLTFKRLARATIKQTRADGRYPRVRWWGEMV